MLESSLSTLLTVVMVVVVPLCGLVALLLAVERVERRRQARIARQVEVTDAIHRELGPVVAPVVKRRAGGGWRVEIAVPFQSPALVGRVGAIAHAAMRRARAADRMAVVLTAQEPPARAARVVRAPMVGKREAAAWTGPTTSRAS